jgi:predicted nucleotidyltransferase component of viral defense system
MAQPEKVDKQFIADLVGKTSFNQTLLAKDYYITKILYLLKDVKGIYFKGGTALQKIFLDHSRLSEDIDFTLTTNVKEKEEEIRRILKDQPFIEEITKDKSVDVPKIIYSHSLFRRFRYAIKGLTRISS